MQFDETRRKETLFFQLFLCCHENESMILMLLFFYTSFCLVFFYCLTHVCVIWLFSFFLSFHCFFRLRNGTRYLQSRLLQERRESHAACQVDASWMLPGKTTTGHIDPFVLSRASCFRVPFLSTPVVVTQVPFLCPSTSSLSPHASLEHLAVHLSTLGWNLHV